MRPILLFFDRLGHLGGVILCALGLGSMGLGVYIFGGSGPWTGAPVWAPGGLVLGGAHFGLGLFIVVTRGLPLLLRGAPPDFRMLSDN